MNYILVGRNGFVSMDILYNWMIEDGYDISLIRQLGPGLQKKYKKQFELKYLQDGMIKTERVDDVHIKEGDKLIRWGSRAPLTVDKGVVEYNTLESLKECSNKLMFRDKMIKNGLRVPFSVSNIKDLAGLDYKKGIVIRPEIHRAGQEYYYAGSFDDATAIIFSKFNHKKWYASEFIDKIGEYRVHIAFGKVISVKEKPRPDDAGTGPWNFAVNEEAWKYIPWGEYNVNMIEACLGTVKSTNIDICAVDVMLDKNGKSYVLEINTAPSLEAYNINRYSKLFNGVLNGQIEIPTELEIKKPNDYAWKNKELNIKKQNNG